MATLRFQNNRKQPIVHKGANGCMNIAFYFKNPVKTGDPIKAIDIELLNGKSPNSGETIICCSCGKTIKNVSAKGWCE